MTQVQAKAVIDQNKINTIRVLEDLHHRQTRRSYMLNLMIMILLLFNGLATQYTSIADSYVLYTT